MIDARIREYQPMPPATSGGFDFKKILAISFRRRWLIIAISVPIIILAVFGTLRSTNLVTASSRVLIEPNNAATLSFRGGRDDITEILATAAQVGMSIPVADIAASALMDSIPVLAQDDPHFAGEINQGDLRDALLGGVHCGAVGESRILQIAFSDPNPRFSLMAVGALTEAFIDYSVKSEKNTRAIEYYDEQIAHTHGEIDSLMVQRANILNSSNYSLFKTSATSENNYSGVLDLDYQRSKSQRLALETKLQGIEEAMKEDPDFLPNTNSLLLRERKDEVEKAKFDLAVLRTKYQDDFALVQRQIQLLTTVQQAFRNEQANFIRDLKIQIKEERKKENTLQAAIQKRTEFLTSFPDVERVVASIDLKIDTKRDLLKNLQVRRGEARLRADTDRRISNIVPLDTPTIEMTVAGSKKILYLFFASFFALALGFMTALFADNQDHRLYDQRQVEQYLEIPVMGSISSSLEFKD